MVAIGTVIGFTSSETKNKHLRTSKQHKVSIYLLLVCFTNPEKIHRNIRADPKCGLLLINRKQNISKNFAGRQKCWMWKTYTAFKLSFSFHKLSWTIEFHRFFVKKHHSSRSSEIIITKVFKQKLLLLSFISQTKNILIKVNIFRKFCPIIRDKYFLRPYFICQQFVMKETVPEMPRLEVINVHLVGQCKICST